MASGGQWRHLVELFLTLNIHLLVHSQEVAMELHVWVRCEWDSLQKFGYEIDNFCLQESMHTVEKPDRSSVTPNSSNIPLVW
jgi:hypothetical protein